MTPTALDPFSLRRPLMLQGTALSARLYHPGEPGYPGLPALDPVEFRLQLTTQLCA